MAKQNSQPFSRLSTSDPSVNRVIQDIYDKLNMIGAQIQNLPGAGQPSPLTPGTFGDSADVPQIVVSKAGVISSITNIPIAAGGGSGITRLTGDVAAGPGSGPQAATLATVNSNVGTFGDGTHVSQVTVNGKGLITAVAAVAITGGYAGPTNQSVVSGARSLGTSYHNTTGKPMWVSVSLYASGGTGSWVAYGQTDASNPPVTAVTFYDATALGIASVSLSTTFVVLPNNYYGVFVSSGSPAIQIWTEWW